MATAVRAICIVDLSMSLYIRFTISLAMTRSMTMRLATPMATASGRDYAYGYVWLSPWQWLCVWLRLSDLSTNRYHLYAHVYVYICGNSCGFGNVW